MVDVSTDRQQGGLQVNVVPDRIAASRLGVRMQDIQSALNNAFAQRQISTLYTQRNNYRVILEIDPQYQRDPTDLARIYVPGANGVQVPLTAVTRIERTLQPLVINHQGPYPAATISFSLAPEVTIDQATRAVDRAVAELHIPDTLRAEFQGDARAYRQGIGAQPLLILAALFAVYIVLGVLYESLAHPITIISTLPSAGLGALLALQMFGTELSLIAFIGIILLIGIVKKNGIIMVDFAIEAERNRGLSPEQAIYEACLERFRPIMMTTLAALLGALPLVLGTGPGIGAAPAARHHHRRRADRLADADALHHAGDLPAARPPAPPALGCARASRAGWIVANGSKGAAALAAEPIVYQRRWAPSPIEEGGVRSYGLSKEWRTPVTPDLSPAGRGRVPPLRPVVSVTQCALLPLPLLHDDLVVQLRPLVALVEDLRRVDHVELHVERPNLHIGRREVASREQHLRLVQHEIQEQHRGMRACRALQHPGAEEARKARRNDVPVERGAGVLQLLGLVVIERERERNLPAHHQIGEQRVALAHGHAVRSAPCRGTA